MSSIIEISLLVQKRTHIRGIKLDIVRRMHEALVVVVTGELPLIVEVAYFVEAPKCDGGGRCAHCSWEPSRTKHLDVMLCISSPSSRAVAETYIRNEYPVRVEDVHASKSARDGA